MNMRSFFRNALGEETTDNKEDGSVSPSGMSNFFSGTSRFLDTVQNKKNDLIQDISSKLTSIKLPGADAKSAPEDSRKESKTTHRGGGEGDSSSASEYGDEGDRPMYAEDSDLQHQGSTESIDSLPDEETANQWKSNISQLVTSLLEHKPIDAQLETEFQNYVLRHSGRSIFAKDLKQQVDHSKEVPASVLDCLTPFVSQVLEKCLDLEDFSPATILAQLCFTLYNEVRAFAATDLGRQVYLYQRLANHVIWQSMRFWNAAYFITLQNDRRHLTVPQELEGEDALAAERELQEQNAYVHLSKFIWRMYALGIGKENCWEFLRKQASATELSKDKLAALQDNLRKFYQA